MDKSCVLEIVAGGREFGSRGAEVFRDRVFSALQKKPRFAFVASGGNTPRPVYEAIASQSLASPLPWDKMHVFLADERNVMPDHPESNFNTLWTTLLSKVPIPKENIHRFHTERCSPEGTHPSTSQCSPQKVAEEYEEDIRTFFALALKEPSDKPLFDMVFLGLGVDGHTASLFPDGIPGVLASANDSNRLVIAPWVTHLNDHRYSLTPSALNASREIVFLVSGSEKASILNRIIEGSVESSVESRVESGGENLFYPAKLIRPSNGSITWLVDRSAAAQLSPDFQTEGYARSRYKRTG